MTIARESQIQLDSTPYYHCMARCVRRAFLCGDDPFSGKNFDHRKQWIVDKLKQLASVFAIDICAYAVMSNHYHVVLRINAEQAKDWPMDEVIERWYQLFKGNMLVDRYLNGDLVSDAELLAVEEAAGTWRKRLMEISWFMRCLNETIAREANAEDQCKGRFWEGRFKSQALLDEAALLTCMMYVDLNPVRAGIADTPENSEYTSIQERIKEFSARTQNSKKTATTPRKSSQNVNEIPPLTAGAAALLPFCGSDHLNNPEALVPFAFKDYVELIDWTGRTIRDGKKGAIPAELAPILERLNISKDEWVESVLYFGHRFKRVIGPIDRIKRYSEKLGVQWCHGVSQCMKVFSALKDTPEFAN
jgi:REP element-mobilizing transposase RayT